MQNQYDQYWRELKAPSRFGRAVALSVVLHVCLGVALWQYVLYRPPKPVQTIYNVSLVPDRPVKEAGKPAPKAEPKPEPPKEEPKPEPPKAKPEPKPEPKAAPPKPKPEPKPKEEPKKELPKEKPKAEKKPDPKPEPKPKPKPEKKVEKKPLPKADPDFEKQLLADSEPEPDPMKTAKNDAPPTPAVSLQQALPSVLNFWGRQVQKKVERHWIIPGGIQIDKNNSEAIVSFYVDSDGNVMGTPQIVKEAADPKLAASGVKAIMDAAPFPPLPEDYPELEQQVIYVFRLQ